MEISVFIAWCAAIISGLAALASIHGSRKSLKRADEANQYAKDANKHAQNANLIHAREWTEQFFYNVKIWADEACNCISIACHLHELNDENEIQKRCTEIRSQLSSIIDRGRWYFPNKWHKEHGLHKEPAYRGKRQPLLDSLVFAYKIIGELPASDPEFRSELVGVQRFFVSEMQEVLNPRKRNEEINLISERFRILEEQKPDSSFAQKYNPDEDA